MATQVERDAVLAPVLVLVGIEVRVLIVQLAVDRPVRANELAQTQGYERSIIGQTIAVLEVEASATGQVPTVIELLRGSSLGNRQTAEQRGSENFLVHVYSSFFGR